MATAIANSNQSLGQRKEDHPSGQPTLPMQLGGEVYPTPWSGINSGVASTRRGCASKPKVAVLGYLGTADRFGSQPQRGCGPGALRMIYNECGGTVKVFATGRNPFGVVRRPLRGGKTKRLGTNMSKLQSTPELHAQKENSLRLSL